MEILKEAKPENEIVSVDTIELTYQVREWIAQPSDGDKLTILRQEKPENEIVHIFELVIEKQEKVINIVVEERDAMIIPGLEKRTKSN